MGFDFLEKIDKREEIVLQIILKYQIENGMKGLMWSKLCNMVYLYGIPKKTFIKVIRDLENKKAVIWKKIEGEKKQAKFYEINPIYFQKSREFYMMSMLGMRQKEIDEYVKECEKMETQEYISKMMLLIYSSFNVLPFYLILFKEDFSRWLYYEANNIRIEELLRRILGRAERSGKDKEETLKKLFEMLAPFSNSHIGIITEADELLKSKNDVMSLLLR